MRAFCLLIQLGMALHIAMATSPPNRTAGILYEIWHTGAAWNMNRIKAAGAEALTVERVIRSDGNKSLDHVFTDGGPPLLPGYVPDIYNTEPELGFYCLYRPRPGEKTTRVRHNKKYDLCCPLDCSFPHRCHTCLPEYHECRNATRQMAYRGWFRLCGSGHHELAPNRAIRSRAFPFY